MKILQEMKLIMDILDTYEAKYGNPYNNDWPTKATMVCDELMKLMNEKGEVFLQQRKIDRENKNTYMEI